MNVLVYKRSHPIAGKFPLDLDKWVYRAHQLSICPPFHLLNLDGVWPEVRDSCYNLALVCLLRHVTWPLFGKLRPSRTQGSHEAKKWPSHWPGIQVTVSTDCYKSSQLQPSHMLAGVRELNHPVLAHSNWIQVPSTAAKQKSLVSKWNLTGAKQWTCIPMGFRERLFLQYPTKPKQSPCQPQGHRAPLWSLGPLQLRTLKGARQLWECPFSRKAFPKLYQASF